MKERLRTTHALPLLLALTLACGGGGGGDDGGGLGAGAFAPPDWVATFGGMPGTDRQLYTGAVFDGGDGPKLYVAGSGVDAAGGALTPGVAVWDGVAWSALSVDSPDVVAALVVHDDGSGEALYAAGAFELDTPSGPARNVARWDGKEWRPVGSGFDASVYTLHVHDDGFGPELYAAGSFTEAGGSAGNAVARWDGATWSRLGDGLQGEARALETYDDGSGPDLYVGGRFDLAGATTVNQVARWNGFAWSDVGGGVEGGVGGGAGVEGGDGVLALEVFDDGDGAKLFAAGAFDTAGGGKARNIAQWNGIVWKPLGAGLDGPAAALRTFDDGTGERLWVGGDFTTADGDPAERVARWGPAGWSSAGGFDSAVLGFVAADLGNGPLLHALGLFRWSESSAALRIAVWRGAWGPLGRGLSDRAEALAFFDDGSGLSLYAGGPLLGASGTTSRGIVRWDGAAWRGVGGGMDDVRALAAFDDGSGAALYAGGAFQEAGGLPAKNIARWDGAAWSAVGGGFDSSIGDVRALAVFDDGGGAALYAGGSFTLAEGAAVARIARWDGATWSGVGGGVNSTVLVLAAFDGALYAGGSFTSAGGVPASRIARWDGAVWSPLGDGLDGTPLALFVHDDGAGPSLFVGGQFDSAGGIATRSVARWDGVAWHALDGGLFGSVQDFAAFDDGGGEALYAAGQFSLPGIPGTERLARWNGEAWSSVTGFHVGLPKVLASIVLDGAPSLVLGGGFDTSPQGDSFLLHYARQPIALAALGPANQGPLTAPVHGIAPAAPAPSIVLDLVLAQADEPLVLEDDVLTHRAFRWIAGDVELRGGTWTSTVPLRIGHQGPARLVLSRGARIVAAEVDLGPEGVLVGEGMIDGDLVNAGVVAPLGGGIELRGRYEERPTGRLEGLASPGRLAPEPPSHRGVR